MGQHCYFNTLNLGSAMQVGVWRRLCTAQARPAAAYARRVVGHPKGPESAGVSPNPRTVPRLNAAYTSVSARPLYCCGTHL